jgi:hypothetical protein
MSDQIIISPYRTCLKCGVTIASGLIPYVEHGFKCDGELVQTFDAEFEVIEPKQLPPPPTEKKGW